jgi:hypothetical protein
MGEYILFRDIEHQRTGSAAGITSHQFPESLPSNSTYARNLRNRMELVQLAELIPLGSRSRNRTHARKAGYSSSNTGILHYNTHCSLFFCAVLNEHLFTINNFNTVARVYILSELKLSLFGIDVNFYENKLAKKNTL